MPRPPGLRVGLLNLPHAQRTQALLWPGPSALPDLQLLSPAALVAHSQSPQRVGTRLERDARALPIYAGRICVMPEHVHLLISEPAQGTPSTMLQALKQRVSRDLRTKTRRAQPGQLSLAFAADEGGLPRFWQPRFHDFNVHSARKRREKLDYMHANPVKRNLVRNPCAWMWSSASFYARGIPGMIPVDPVP